MVEIAIFMFLNSVRSKNKYIYFFGFLLQIASNLSNLPPRSKENNVVFNLIELA